MNKLYLHIISLLAGGFTGKRVWMASVMALLFSLGHGQIYVSEGTSIVISGAEEKTDNPQNIQNTESQNAKTYVYSVVDSEISQKAVAVIYQGAAESTSETKTMLTGERNKNLQSEEEADDIKTVIAKNSKPVKKEKPIIKVRLNSVPGNSSMAAGAFNSTYGISSVTPSWAVRSKSLMIATVIPDWITKDLNADFKNEFYSSFYIDAYSVRPPPFIG